MKIAVSSTAPGLDAPIDQRFGRCRYFVVVDPDTLKYESLKNEGSITAGGAGSSTAQVITKKGVTVVMTGNCGPNAFSVLNAAGIDVITGVSGTVKDAVNNYKKRDLKADTRANVPDHFGDGKDRGMGRGLGRRMI